MAAAAHVFRFTLRAPCRAIRRCFLLIVPSAILSSLLLFFFNHLDSGRTGPFEILPERLRYDRLGPFGNFSKVALRQRVGCVDPITGVPMSIQWDKVPYFYPIQIFQFGLGQFNLNKTGEEIVVRRLVKRVQISAGKAAANSPFTNAGDGNGTMSLDDNVTVHAKLFRRLPILLFTLKTHRMDSEFVLELEKRLKGGGTFKMALFFKHLPGKRCVWRDEFAKEPPISVVFNIGPKPSTKWMDFVIDSNVYAIKALKLFCKSKNESEIKRELCQAQNNEFLPKSVLFKGPCLLRVHSLRQQSSAHAEMFHKVADWVLSNQDEKGGWPVPVSRTISEGQHRLVLPIGWQSAMAQGLALSFLTRAYALANDEEKDRYLKSAQKALNLYELPLNEGGVLSNIYGLPWFEEYPTLPWGTGVLNGFLYALFGLFDFALYSKKSHTLFVRGLNSLRHLLHRFDDGHWSLYDLRHINLNNSQPKMARLDYHLLHVSQLRWMYSITGDTFFEETAKRWEEYARG